MKLEKLILTFDQNRKDELLKVLQSINFIHIENEREVLDKFIRNAPQEVPLEDEDILAELEIVRKISR